jgi:hypothetical protein
VYSFSQFKRIINFIFGYPVKQDIIFLTAAVNDDITTGSGPVHIVPPPEYVPLCRCYLRKRQHLCQYQSMFGIVSYIAVCLAVYQRLISAARINAIIINIFMFMNFDYFPDDLISFGFDSKIASSNFTKRSSDFDFDFNF